MTFTYPYALLAMLAIPVLIVIYILKNKFKEETAPSSYLWEISEKFLKKRNPLRKVEHLISLIIQILAIAAFSIAVAQPVITLPGMASNIVFVLDTSASMQIETDEKEGGKNLTRFEKAVDMIYDVANKAAKGSKFSLVTTDDSSREVCKGVSDLSRFEIYLNSVEVTQYTTGLETAVNIAQSYLSDGTAAECYLATDKTVENHNNIELLDVSGSQENYAVYDVKAEYESKELTISFSCISYISDQTLSIDIYSDAHRCGSTKVEVKAGTEETRVVTLTNSDDYDYSTFDSVTCTITNEDYLSLDNTCIYYKNNALSTTSVCLVSDNTNNKKLFQAAFHAWESTMPTDVTPLATSSYPGTKSYDIYIFDSFLPTTLPTTGSIWIFNAPTDATGSGFYYQDSYTLKDNGGIEANFTDNETDIIYSALTKDLTTDTLSIANYQRYSLVSDFTVIASYNNAPIIFAGRNENGQRQAVFSFSLEDTSFSVSYNWPIIVRNLLGYSNPDVLTDFNYSVNETATFALSDSIKEINLLHPSKKQEPMELDNDYVDYTFDEIGTYTITIIYNDGSFKQFYVYISYPKEEGNPIDKDTTKYSLARNTSFVTGDGIFDNLLPIIIVASVFFALDWILYTHEQY